MACFKIHLVYEEEYLNSLKEVLEEIGHEITGYDYSLGQFADFSEKKQTDADLAIIDGQAGIAERKEIIDYLSRVRKNLPNLRLIVVLPLLLERDQNFVSKLLAMSIYDMYFKDEYTIDDLENWINNPKDYSSYNVETKDLKGTIRPDEKPRVVAPASEHEKYKKQGPERFKGFTEKIKRLTSLKSMIKQLNIYYPDKNKTPVDVDKIKAVELNDIGLEKQQAEKLLSLYGLGNIEGAINFKDIEQLITASEIVRPDAILMEHNEDIVQNIKAIKRHKTLHDVFLIIIGTNGTHDIYKAGADECFPNWNKENIFILKNKLIPNSQKTKALQDDDSYKDFLTGLYNRRGFEECIKDYIYKYKKHATPFCLMFCDLDYFKRINDTHGHAKGDEVLKEFAKHLVSGIRSIDVAVRYGGEEFAVIFANANISEIAPRAEELRTNWQLKNILGSTFSAGVGEYKGENIELFTQKVDKALYMAKNSGRNKVLYIQEEQDSCKKPDKLICNYSRLQTSVYAVIGASKRVGATSFALVLAKTLSQKYPVEILDAGGGAYDWLGGRGDKNIEVRKCPPYSISPGVITIIDAGTKINEELRPFIEANIIITDMSKDAVYIKELINGRSFLVGNRCIIDIKELAEVWGLEVLCEIGEDKAIKIAEANSIFPESKHLNKKVKEIFVS